MSIIQGSTPSLTSYIQGWTVLAGVENPFWVFILEKKAVHLMSLSFGYRSHTIIASFTGSYSLPLPVSNTNIPIN